MRRSGLHKANPSTRSRTATYLKAIHTSPHMGQGFEGKMSTIQMQNFTMNKTSRSKLTRLDQSQPHGLLNNTYTQGGCSTPTWHPALITKIFAGTEEPDKTHHYTPVPGNPDYKAEEEKKTATLLSPGSKATTPHRQAASAATVMCTDHNVFCKKNQMTNEDKGTGRAALPATVCCTVAHPQCSGLINDEGTRLESH